MNFEREKADILFDYGLLLQFCCHLIQIYTVSSLRTATLTVPVYAFAHHALRKIATDSHLSLTPFISITHRSVGPSPSFENV